MNQKQLVEHLAGKTGLSKAQVNTVLKALANTVEQTLVDDGKVHIAGLGTWSRAWNKPRALRGINDGRKVYIDGRFTPAFRAAKSLRRRLEELTPQRWRDPAHQAAQRVARTLVGDLYLYGGEQAPELKGLDVKAAGLKLADAFGDRWERAVEIYTSRVPAEVREGTNYLVAAALQH